MYVARLPSSEGGAGLSEQQSGGRSYIVAVSALFARCMMHMILLDWFNSIVCTYTDKHDVIQDLGERDRRFCIVLT